MKKFKLVSILTAFTMTLGMTSIQTFGGGNVQNNFTVTMGATPIVGAGISSSTEKLKWDILKENTKTNDSGSTYFMSTAYAGRYFNIYIPKTYRLKTPIQDNVEITGNVKTSMLKKSERALSDNDIKEKTYVALPEDTEFQGYLAVLFNPTDAVIVKAGGGVDLNLNFTEEDKFNVNFINEGESFKQEIVYKGDKVTAPDNTPTKEGFNFLGWFLENAEERFDFETPITAETTLISKFEAKKTDEKPVIPDNGSTTESDEPVVPTPTPDVDVPVQPEPTPSVPDKPTPDTNSIIPNDSIPSYSGYIDPIEDTTTIPNTIIEDEKTPLTPPTSDIEDEDVILDGDLEKDIVTEIKDDSTPLADDVIEDEKTPLADMPKTNDNMRLSEIISVISVMVLVGAYATLDLLKNKKEDK